MKKMKTTSNITLKAGKLKTGKVRDLKPGQAEEKTVKSPPSTACFSTRCGGEA
jgi:hypothetical protein